MDHKTFRTWFSILFAGGVAIYCLWNVATAIYTGKVQATSPNGSGTVTYTAEKDLNDFRMGVGIYVAGAIICGVVCVFSWFYRNATATEIGAPINETPPQKSDDGSTPRR